MGKGKDLRPRKSRNDRGKKRKLYKGKPVKGKRQIKNERKQGNKDYLKLWVWEKVERSPESALKFKARVRPFMARHPVVMFRNRHDLRTEEINSQQKIERFFEENYYPGDFLLMGFSHGKNRYHVKPIKICAVLVTENPDGMKARMTHKFRLSRYKWFYKG